MIEGSSSDGQDAVGLLEHLTAERRTGCLTLHSAAAGTYRLYLLFGSVYHAVGPSGEGSSALDEAMSLRDATVSFDEQARLPERHTISVRGAGLDGSSLRPLQRSPNWSRWAALGAIRSCLVVILLLVVGLPLTLVIAGVALAPLGVRTEVGYRSAPICTGTPTKTPCYRIEQVSVQSATYQWGRWGSWTEHVRVDTAGGSGALVIYAAYPLQPNPAFPSSTVQVKVYEGRITTLYTGGRTYETVDSPINRSPLGPAVVMLTCGGLYFLIMVAIRRKRLLSDARGIWTLWAGPRAAA
jgi:hypothetical protein